MYKSPLRIHFDECDPAGILFYGQVLHLSHRHIEMFLEHIGIPWKDWFSHEHWAVPVRHAEVNYLRPLFAGQTYQCEVTLTKLGSSYVQFETLFKDPSGDICTKVKSAHVFLDKSSGQKMAVPEELLELLKTQLSQ